MTKFVAIYQESVKNNMAMSQLRIAAASQMEELKKVAGGYAVWSTKGCYEVEVGRVFTKQELHDRYF